MTSGETHFERKMQNYLANPINTLTYLRELPPSSRVNVLDPLNCLAHNLVKQGLRRRCAVGWYSFQYVGRGRFGLPALRSFPLPASLSDAIIALAQQADRKGTVSREQAIATVSLLSGYREPVRRPALVSIPRAYYFPEPVHPLLGYSVADEAERIIEASQQRQRVSR